MIDGNRIVGLSNWKWAHDGTLTTRPKIFAPWTHARKMDAVSWALPF